MEAIESTLGPIQAVLWGERAIAALGAPVVCEHYMLVVHDAEYDDAVARMRAARYQDCVWSYGSVNPSFYEERSLQHIYRRITKDYRSLDQNSTRFFFPLEQQNITTKIVLLRSSYAHIQPSNDHESEPGHSIQYPDASALLRSFIQTLLRDPSGGMWTSTLSMWAISYTYGELMVPDDALDSCDDEEAKAWFNDSIRRFTGGMDRTTDTKRAGKLTNRNA